MKGFKAEEQFMDACILDASVETNGFCGGYAGHGSRTTVILSDTGSVCGEIVVNDQFRYDLDKLEISVAGDAELRVLISALEWAAKKLREGSGYYCSNAVSDIEDGDDIAVPSCPGDIIISTPGKEPDFGKTEM